MVGEAGSGFRGDFREVDRVLLPSDQNFSMTEVHGDKADILGGLFSKAHTIPLSLPAKFDAHGLPASTWIRPILAF